MREVAGANGGSRSRDLPLGFLMATGLYFEYTPESICPLLQLWMVSLGCASPRPRAFLFAWSCGARQDYGKIMRLAQKGISTSFKTVNTDLGHVKNESSTRLGQSRNFLPVCPDYLARFHYGGLLVHCIHLPQSPKRTLTACNNDVETNWTCDADLNHFHFLLEFTVCRSSLELGLDTHFGKVRQTPPSELIVIFPRQRL